jgi:site-specific DNA recombinase
MLRAALYARVSDDKAGQSRSVAEQNAAGRLAAAEHGWTLTEYAESGSASRYTTRVRPEWARLQNDVRVGRYAAVILWEPSRGGRELEAWAAFLNVCRAVGCDVYITSHHQLYRLTRARDWRSLAEDGVDSAYESDKTSLRVRRAYASAATAGRPMGRAAYGYLRRYGPHREPEQYPDPETAPIVRELITRIAASEAISHLVADLYRRGIASPTAQPRWSRNSVIRLVKDGLVYISKRRSAADGTLLDCNWEPLVDSETFWAARRVLADPARKRQADARGGIRPGAAKWLLSYSSATCGRCGAPLNVVSRKAGPVYRCSTSGTGCAGAPVEWLDALISAAIVRWASQPEVFAELTRSDSSDAASALGAAAEGRERLAGLEAQCAAGEISGPSFARMAALIEASIAEHEAAAASSATSPALRALLSSAESDSDNRENIIGAMFSTMNLQARRKVISTLCDISLSPVGEFSADSPWRVRLQFRTG